MTMPMSSQEKQKAKIDVLSTLNLVSMKVKTARQRVMMAGDDHFSSDHLVAAKNEVLEVSNLCEQAEHTLHEIIDAPLMDPAEDRVMPKRIQRKRTKGWRMPPNTVSICRPGKFGNPYRVVPFGRKWGVLIPVLEDNSGMVAMGFDRLFSTRKEACAYAVELFKKYLNELSPFSDEQISKLRGKDVACWCREEEPCHGDVLLELANK